MATLKPVKLTYLSGTSLTSDELKITGDTTSLIILLSLMDQKSVVYPNNFNGSSLNHVILQVGGKNGISKEKLLAILPLFDVA